MTAGAALRRIHIKDVPVDLWARARQWFEGLIREFDIIATHGDGTPRDLVEFVGSVSEEFGRFAPASNATMEEAWQRGESRVDVDLELPVRAAGVAHQLLDHIDAADRFCREGQLLTLALEDDIRTYVGWYLGEVAAQIEGAQPTSWDERA